MAKKVPLSARFGFGVGDLSFNLVWQGTSLFLLYFYTDVLGISPAIAGSIYLAAMIWDAITDPVIATFADRTHTSMGKYRPWLLFGAVPFAISYPLAFSSPPEFLPFNTVVWALITHLMLRTTYTIVSMPFNALQARLTDDPDERTVLSGFRMIGAAIGALTVSVSTPILVNSYSELREAEAYFVAGCIVGAVAFAALLYCFFSMREPESGSVTAPPKFWDDIKSIGPILINNPPLIRMFGVITVGSICMTMFNKCIIYHFKYQLKSPELAPLGLLILMLSLVLTVPIWVWFSGKTSKRTALSVGIIIALAGYVAFFFDQSGEIVLTLIEMGLIGVGSAALAVMFWAMLADTIEYGEAMTGVRAEAKTFGFATFAQKVAVGVSAVLLTQSLNLVGFQPNADQGETTLMGMKAIMALIPTVGCIAILLILRGYTLDREEHAKLVERIQAAKT